MTSFTARKIKGITKLRKTLNRIDNEQVQEVRRAIFQGAIAIRNDGIMLASAQDIRLTGDMIRSIDYNLSKDKMTAVIGPGAKSARVRKNPFDTRNLTKGLKQPAAKVRHKDAQWNLMKAWWAEFGTGPPIIQHPQPFMNPAYEMNKAWISRITRNGVRVALKRAARGR